MSGHTPGPWTANGMLVDATVLGGRQMIVDASFAPGTATCNANALLVAAAPDMLAACVALVDGSTRSLREDIDLAKAAIAKARGES